MSFSVIPDSAYNDLFISNISFEILLNFSLSLNTVSNVMLSPSIEIIKSNPDKDILYCLSFIFIRFSLINLTISFSSRFDLPTLTVPEI